MCIDILARVTYKVDENWQERRVGVDILRIVPVGAQHDWLKLIGGASQEMCQEETNFEEDADEWQSEHREAHKRKARNNKWTETPKKRDHVRGHGPEVQRNTEFQFCDTEGKCLWCGRRRPLM